MHFGSVCSGIEAASIAFAPLGWKAAWLAEIEPFPSAVLAHHYPDVPNFGDMTKFREWPEEVFVNADAIVGGPPCQSFSLAGMRAGLNDDRGSLTLTYAELINHADAIRTLAGKPPVIILYENVPGVLSTKDNAFGCFLAGPTGSTTPPATNAGRQAQAQTPSSAAPRGRSSGTPINRRVIRRISLGCASASEEGSHDHQRKGNFHHRRSS